MTYVWSPAARGLNYGLLEMALLDRATYGGSPRNRGVSALSLKIAHSVDVQDDDKRLRLAERT